LIARGNRLKVDRYSRVEGYEDIFAIGDIAYMVTEKYPESHPQVANVALKPGRPRFQRISGTCYRENHSSHLSITTREPWRQ
jgi:NADH dehydrogenase FAD-containing subunit